MKRAETEHWTSSDRVSVSAGFEVSLCLSFAGIFAPVSKISKAVDQTPSSVTSTPRTPRIDLASRLAGKTKKEKEKKEKEREKGSQISHLFKLDLCVCISC